MEYHKIYTYDNTNTNFKLNLESYYKKIYSIDNFENIHLLLDTNVDLKQYYTNIPIFGKTDRTSPFIKNFYKYVDTDYEFIYNYLKFIEKNIKPLFNEKLIIQKTPNIRFHLPECTNIGKRDTDEYSDIIGLHKDIEFGHHPNELNVIIPITDMYDTNSIYFESEPKSDQNVYDYQNLKLNKNNFSINKFNSCLHYNKINKTDITRVSLDFRIIPYSKYYEQPDKESATDNIKFKIGDYYMLF